MGRIRAGVAFAVGLGAIATDGFLRFLPPQAAMSPDGFGDRPAVAALAFGFAALLGGFIARPRRNPWVLFGLMPLAAVLSVVMAIVALFYAPARAVLIPAALEAAGGFALLAGCLRFAEAKVERALPPLPKRRRARRLEVRDGRDEQKARRAREVPVEELEPGDEVQLAPGADVPTDGTILSGSGFVDESPLFGPSLPLPKRPGDPIFAGTSASIPDLVLRVGTPVQASLAAQRDELVRALGAEIAGAGSSGRFVAFVATLVTIFGAALLLAPADLGTPEAWMPATASLLLAGVAGASARALIAGRISILLLARRAGLIIARAKDLFALSAVRRWQMDPRILAAPGEVDLVVLGEDRGYGLLAVAEALVATEQGPGLMSLSAAARARRVPPLPAAALRRGQSVYHGTVQGDRWFLGPERAVLDEEGVRLPRTLEPAVKEFRERSMLAWLLGRHGSGVVAALGIGLGADVDAKGTAEKLRATVMPGIPDATRQAIAHVASISVDGPPLLARDATLLAEDSPSPSTGLRIRVVRPRPGLDFRSDRAPRLFRPSLANFGDVILEARGIARASRVRAGALAVLPGILALAAALLGASSPLVGAGIGIAAVIAAGGPRRWT